MLFLFVFGPLGVLVGVLLRPVAILLLDRKPFHVVRVHDLLDSLVVVKDGETWHLVEVSQVRIVLISTSDERITRVLQSRATHGPRLSAFHSLLLGLLRPIGARSVVEGGRAPELAADDLGLTVDLVFNLLLSCGVVVVLM